MLSKMCLEGTARTCAGSRLLTYSQHLSFLLDACFPLSFKSEVARNVMRHVFLSKS